MRYKHFGRTQETLYQLTDVKKSKCANKQGKIGRSVLVDRFVLPLSSADNVTYIGRPAGKNLEVSEYRLVEILSQHFTRITEKKHENLSQGSQRSGVVLDRSPA